MTNASSGDAEWRAMSGNRHGVAWRPVGMLLAAVALQAAASARASSAQEAGEETICVMPLTLWSGGLEETRDIAAVPVPESYRRMLGGGRATRWTCRR